MLLYYIYKGREVSELLSREDVLLKEHTGYKPLFRRYFLSDIRQRELFPERNGAVSYIIQPPLGGEKLAGWMIMAPEKEVGESGGVSYWKTGKAEMLFHASQCLGEGDSYFQTRTLLDDYQKKLEKEGMDMEANCVRTWFYCDDIDHTYGGLVKARREWFAAHGMLPRTHYIASTGIGGKAPADGVIVSLDALSVRGNYSQQYLYGRTHLSATSDYGVTFERGVRLNFGKEPMVLISGTASINEKGQILHEGNVRAQTRRMWENVEVLLREGGAGWNDVKMILVYLRNPEDAETVGKMFAERFPQTPYILLHAPVCRPGWLVEMECMANIIEK